jgi:hypothetical protein
LLEEDLEDAESVGLGCEQTRIEQSGLPFTLAAAEPVDERCHRGDSDREQERDSSARGPHLVGDSLPESRRPAQAANLGRDVERYIHNHFFAAAH